MKAKIYRLEHMKMAEKLEQKVESSLSVRLKAYKLIYETDIPETDINDIEQAIPESDVGYISDLVQLDDDFFFCATMSWWHVSIY